MNAEARTLWLAERLTDYATHYGVPGAVAAIHHDGRSYEVATGTLNAATRVAVTRDSLFQIGSITKTFTATLVLQLVERGRVRLDDPVRLHLPWFAVASEDVTRSVTLRHLLTHTSGIDGDFFPDTGADSDCIEKYVRACAGLGQVHAPDECVSYCNAAFIVLGAMLEHITGQTWGALLQQRILQPLGLTRSTADYAQLPLYRVAVGHLPNKETKQLEVARRIHLPPGMGPTGSTLHMSAGDLARFGEAFLDGGRAPEGTRILDAQTVALSREVYATWPTSPWTGMAMGLGWLLYTWDGRSVFGHDGATIGQASYLRIMPDANLVVTLLTNGGPAKNLYNALFRDIFAELADTQLPQPPKIMDPSAFDAARVIGTYENKSTVARILLAGGELRVQTTVRELTDVVSGETWPLVPIAPNACRIANPATETAELAVFHHFDAGAGRARFATLNHRDLLRRDS